MAFFFIETVLPNVVVGCGLFKSLEISNIERLTVLSQYFSCRVGKSDISACVMSCFK